MNAHYQAVLDTVDVELVLSNYPPRVGGECGFPTLDDFADNTPVLGIEESELVMLRISTCMMPDRACDDRNPPSNG